MNIQFILGVSLLQYLNYVKKRNPRLIEFIDLQSNLDISNSDITNSAKFEASIWTKNNILIAFSNNNLALGTFLQVQITRSAN